MAGYGTLDSLHVLGLVYHTGERFQPCRTYTACVTAGGIAFLTYDG